MKGLCIHNDGNSSSLTIYIVYYTNCSFLYILLIRRLCDPTFKHTVKLFMSYPLQTNTEKEQNENFRKLINIRWIFEKHFQAKKREKSCHIWNSDTILDYVNCTLFQYLFFKFNSGTPDSTLHRQICYKIDLILRKFLQLLFPLFYLQVSSRLHARGQISWDTNEVVPDRSPQLTGQRCTRGLSCC